MSEAQEVADRLAEIKEEMLELIGEANELLCNHDVITHERARRTWIAHIECSLTRDHSWLDRSTNMEDTIEELTKGD